MKIDTLKRLLNSTSSELEKDEIRMELKKKEKEQRNNIKQRIMIGKAILKGISVSEKEIDEYISHMSPKLKQKVA